MFPSAIASLHTGCCSVGQPVVVGNPTVLWPEGGDGFLRKLLAEKTPSLRCLLFVGQRQAKGSACLSAAAAKDREGFLAVSP